MFGLELLDIHNWDVGLDLPNSDCSSQQFWQTPARTIKCMLKIL